MLFAEISDAVWLAVIGLVYMAVKEWFDSKRAREAASHVEEVKKTLSDNVAVQEETNKVASDKMDAIHGLVNSAMLAQKKMMRDKCRAAVLENPSATNKAESIAADEAYDEHLRQQNLMEAKD